MRERRWGDSGPSCSKALTCGHEHTPREGGVRGAKGRQQPLGWSQREHRVRTAMRGPRRSPEKLQDPPHTLSSIEDSRLVSWLSLVTMLLGLASPDTWEMRKRADKDAVTGYQPLRGVPRGAPSRSIPPTTPEGLLSCPFADEGIRHIANHLKMTVAPK